MSTRTSALAGAAIGVLILVALAWQVGSRQLAPTSDRPLVLAVAPGDVGFVELIGTRDERLTVVELDWTFDIPPDGVDGGIALGGQWDITIVTCEGGVLSESACGAYAMGLPVPDGHSLAARLEPQGGGATYVSKWTAEVHTKGAQALQPIGPPVFAKVVAP